VLLLLLLLLLLLRSDPRSARSIQGTVRRATATAVVSVPPPTGLAIVTSLLILDDPREQEVLPVRLHLCLTFSFSTLGPFTFSFSILGPFPHSVLTLTSVS